MNRLHEWETAEIIIRLWGAKDPLEYTERSDPSQRLQSPDESNKSVVTYMQNRGLRQSKRVKDIKHLGEYRTVVITRATTVKDIKVNVIPISCFFFFFWPNEELILFLTVTLRNLFSLSIVLVFCPPNQL